MADRYHDPIRELLEQFERATVPVPLAEGAGGTAGAEGAEADASGARSASGVADPFSADDYERHFLERRLIGCGGMGEVREAFDTQLLRTVAMKSLMPGLARSLRRIAAFVEEARIHAQLDHPNIVPVHSIGVDDAGKPFFTMKLVRGVSLYTWLHHPSRPVGSSERLQDALEIFLRVCDAISFAHARGVIHRDLKPDNVMVGEFGEVYVMDWGLARLVGPAAASSAARPSAPPDEGIGPVGTPAYMAPEAARGLPESCDERTDVFGLGAILYEIATGHVPYCTLDGKVALAAARRGGIVPPEGALAGIGVSKRLLRIVTKALAEAPEERFASAAELKEAVTRFLRGGLHLPREAYPAGARIVVEGEAGDAAYIIVRGECEAYKTVDGERRVLRRMGPGDVFGETAVLSDLPRTATVEAIGTVTLLVVTRAALEEGLGPDTWLGALVKALALRFRELDERVSAGR